MPMCGFNKKMLNGLDKLHEGMVKNITKKLKEARIR